MYHDNALKLINDSVGYGKKGYYNDMLKEIDILVTIIEQIKNILTPGKSVGNSEHRNFIHIADNGKIHFVFEKKF